MFSKRRNKSKLFSDFVSFSKSLANLYVTKHLNVSECLQCYSCKATGTNELDANIKCLENAYLENCEEFYDYYNEIEDQDVISYEYYYYDKEDDAKDPKTDTKEGKSSATRPSNRKEDLSPSRRNKRAVKEIEKEKTQRKLKMKFHSTMSTSQNIIMNTNTLMIMSQVLNRPSSMIWI